MSAEDHSHSRSGTTSESQRESEASPFCKVELRVKKDQQELFVHKADLDTETSIGELKKQLKDDGIIKSDDQVWYLGDIELHDDKCLGHYEITGANKIFRDPIPIYVHVTTLS